MRNSGLAYKLTEEPLDLVEHGAVAFFEDVVVACAFHVVAGDFSLRGGGEFWGHGIGDQVVEGAVDDQDGD